MERRHFLVAAGTGFALPAARSQEKVLRLVVPFAPGGSGDLIPRIVAPALAEILGQPVIVENRAGAGGSVGTAFVAKAPPDGLTLGVATVSTHGIYPAVMRQVPYDVAKDFAPVTCMARVPNVVSVHPSVDAGTLAELIKLARNPSSQLNYGTPGIGSLGHMMGELFKQNTRTYMTHIPYRGAGPALQDATAGQVQVLFDNLPASLPHIKAGRLRCLAVAWPTRHAALPSVPTFAEAGVMPLNQPAWFGLVAPAGTPSPLLQKIQQAAVEALARPAVRMRIEDIGAVPVGDTAAAFANEMRDDLQRWREVARVGRISLEP